MTGKFQESLKRYFEHFSSAITTEDGDWTVKGFIDVYKNIYAISADTKVISKIIEPMIFPIILQFASDNGYEMLPGSPQNYYPDITVVDKITKEKIALTLRNTCRTDARKVSGMSLGNFTGYFRKRTSTKNVHFPYSQYSRHYILGIVYTNTEYLNATRCLESHGITLTSLARKALSQYVSHPSQRSFYTLSKAIGLSVKHHNRIKSIIDSCIVDKSKVYNLDQLRHILSTVRDFNFFVQEKWKIATDRPAFSNALHISSTTSIKELMTGTALFTKYKDGEAMFNDYWIYYLAKDMLHLIDLEKPPYTNISEYFQYKGLSK